MDILEDKILKLHENGFALCDIVCRVHQLGYNTEKVLEVLIRRHTEYPVNKYTGEYDFVIIPSIINYKNKV